MTLFINLLPVKIIKESIYSDFINQNFKGTIYIINQLIKFKNLGDDYIYKKNADLFHVLTIFKQRHVTHVLILLPIP